MKYAIGSLATALVTLLVAVSLTINGNVAWVTKKTFEGKSEKFAGTATCQTVHYTGFNFGHTVVTGYVPLGGSSGAYGGHLLRADYTIPGHMYYAVETSWGRVNYYGQTSFDRELMIASACIDKTD